MPEARRVVVVTGASAGVGRATARRFAAEGTAIGLLARGGERLEAAAREIKEAGSEALAVAVDVSDAEAVEVAATSVEEELGPIDVWVNNAMATVFAPVVELNHEEFRRVTDVTYLGSVWGTMAALRRMRPRDRGTIVQVGSALAYRSIPLQSGYCGAKHALQGFLDSLRTELLHDGSGIRVTAVHLPALNTPQFNWGRTKMTREPQPVPPIFQPEVGRGGGRLGREQPPPRGLGRLADRPGDRRRQAGSRAPRPPARPNGLRRSAGSTSPSRRDGRTTCSSPPRGTSAPTGASTEARRGAACSSG